MLFQDDTVVTWTQTHIHTDRACHWFVSVQCYTPLIALRIDVAKDNECVAPISRDDKRLPPDP